MRYFKQVSAGYICAIGVNTGGEEINAGEYGRIMDSIRSKPPAAAGFDHRLKTDLTWEEYALPAEDPDPELEAEEALTVIMGGSV